MGSNRVGPDPVGLRGARRRSRQAPALALAVALALVTAACGEPPPSPTSSPSPTPTVTPDPHLPDPTTADDVYLGLGRAGLRITSTNATAGAPGDPLVKRINATWLGWPLAVAEYRSSLDLAELTPWLPGDAPGQGDPPVAIAGANILVTWGPSTGASPASPDPRQAEGLADLIRALDALLSPLRARSTVPLDVPGVVIGPTAPPSPVPSGAAATPTP